MAFQRIRRRSTPDLDITDLMTGVTSGRLILTRDDSQVWLDFQALDTRSIGGTFAMWGDVLPQGLQPPRITDLPLISRGSTGYSSTVRIAPDGQIVIYRHTEDVLRGLVSFRTRQAMPAPSAYPGIEVA